jgi:hypothetical protein
VSEPQRLGRIENGLGRDLATRHDIPAAERAALRAQARAVDVAEAARDSDAVSRANAVYLDLRRAAGLSADGSKPGDAIDVLVAELLRPGPGVSDIPNT